MPIDALTVDEVREAYEALIKEKDQRIAELEKEVADLKNKVCGYQDMLSFDEGWKEDVDDDQ